jgi:hypothetical protein
MSGTIPPLPQYVLIAWCSVKVQGQLLKCVDRHVRQLMMMMMMTTTTTTTMMIVNMVFLVCSLLCQYFSARANEYSD